ncbi:threonine synthase [bacterium]|nr:threonine synthase [bacterium]
MAPLTFYSTNRSAPCVSLAEALLQGQAPDRGLYLPSEIPRVSPEELAGLRDAPYSEIARFVISQYTPDTVIDSVLDELCTDAYDFDVPLEPVGDRRFVMRLDRGPTASFKDFAARMMARMFGVLRRNADSPLVILTATSGDTGSAIAHAFYGIPNIQVMVLFPPKEVSNRQRKQMTTLGGNITIVALDGQFDDCQALVKQAFADPDLQSIDLTSANSINIGRLLPQIVYYVYAYVKLAKQGEPITLCVPSGNFGNMMGAVLARRMGIPIRRIVIATNANDEVPVYFRTREYGKIVPSRVCISNAMNVGHPSNFARVIDLYGGWMDETGLIREEPDVKHMHRDLWSVSIDDEETRRTIQEVWNRHGVLLEPHGAVGWAGLSRYIRETGETGLTLSVETAHPAKFPEEIRHLLGFDPDVPDSLSSVETKEESYLNLDNNYERFRMLIQERYG